MIEYVDGSINNNPALGIRLYRSLLITIVPRLTNLFTIILIVVKNLLTIIPANGGEQSRCIANVGDIKEIKIVVSSIFVTDEVSTTYITRVQCSIY